MVKVEFTKNFANKKKGDTEGFDSQLASTLVNVKKVAKYTPEEQERQKERKDKHELSLKLRKEQLAKVAKSEKERIAKLKKAKEKAEK